MLKITKLECTDKNEKSHRLYLDAGILGEFGFWLCDGCFEKLDSKDLMTDVDELEEYWEQNSK